MAESARSETRHRWFRRAPRSDGHPDELRRAQLIIASGLAVWGLLAALVMIQYGAIASFVLVGWGGSVLVCLAFALPLGLHRRTERPRPAEHSATATPPIAAVVVPEPAPAAVEVPIEEVIDLREVRVEPVPDADLGRLHPQPS